MLTFTEFVFCTLQISVVVCSVDFVEEGWVEYSNWPHRFLLYSWC